MVVPSLGDEDDDDSAAAARGGSGGAGGASGAQAVQQSEQPLLWRHCSRLLECAARAEDSSCMSLAELLQCAAGGTLFRMYEHDENGDEIGRGDTGAMRQRSVERSARTAAKKRRIERVNQGAAIASTSGEATAPRQVVLIRRSDPREYKEMMHSTLVAPDGQQALEFFLPRNNGGDGDGVAQNAEYYDVLRAGDAAGTTTGRAPPSRSITDIAHRAVEILFSQRYVLVV